MCRNSEAIALHLLPLDKSAAEGRKLSSIIGKVRGKGSFLPPPFLDMVLWLSGEEWRKDGSNS